MPQPYNERQFSANFLRFFSLIPLGLGLLTLLSGGMSSLKCQRFAPPEGLCELTEANLLWKNSRQWYLSDIQLIKAINQKRQLRLQTAKGEIWLMPYYSSLGRTAITH